MTAMRQAWIVGLLMMLAQPAAAQLNPSRQITVVVPIGAGGTGLYLRALLQGIAPMPPRDEDLRRELNARASASSPETLHRELETLDPVSAEGPQAGARPAVTSHILGAPVNSGDIVNSQFNDSGFAVGLKPRKLRLYADHNFPFAVVEELRHARIPVMTAAEDGRAYHDDSAVYARAKKLDSCSSPSTGTSGTTAGTRSKRGPESSLLTFLPISPMPLWRRWLGSTGQSPSIGRSTGGRA